MLSLFLRIEVLEVTSYVCHCVTRLDYLLRSGFKIFFSSKYTFWAVQYKTGTADYGLGIKNRLGYETRTEHYGLGIKYLYKLLVKPALSVTCIGKIFRHAISLVSRLAT